MVNDCIKMRAFFSYIEREKYVSIFYLRTARIIDLKHEINFPNRVQNCKNGKISSKTGNCNNVKGFFRLLNMKRFGNKAKYFESC